MQTILIPGGSKILVAGHTVNADPHELSRFSSFVSQCFVCKVVIFNLIDWHLKLMNELPVIGSLCLRTDFWDVWRTVVPKSKKTILVRFSLFRRSFIWNGFGQCLYKEGVSLCLKNHVICSKIYRWTCLHAPQAAQAPALRWSSYAIRVMSE